MSRRVSIPLEDQTTLDIDDMRELLRDTSFGKAELEALFQSYVRNAENDEQGMTKEEFTNLMRLHGIEDDKFLEKLYLNMDISHAGLVTFKEVATSFSVLLRGSTTDMAEFEFSIWDTNNDGRLTAEEFQNFFYYAKSIDGSTRTSDDQIKKEAMAAFNNVDKDKKGYITADEFRDAVEDHELHVGDPFYAFIHDPLNHKASKGAIAGFSAEERALFHLMGERVNVRKGVSIPTTVDEVIDVFYLLVEGRVTVKEEDGSNPKTIVPGLDGFLYDETVFVKGLEASPVQGLASKDSVLIRIVSADFMNAYLSDVCGAPEIFKRIKNRLRNAMLEEEEDIQRTPGKQTTQGLSRKKSVLQFEGKVLTPHNINPLLSEMQYAVRGLVPITAEKIQQEIASGKSKRPFKEILYCNIGNPHSVGQKPITFYREVLSLVDCPTLLERPGIEAVFKPDIIARAKFLLGNIKGGTGAYSHSQGIPAIRQNVAKFIEKRDGHPCKPGDLFLTNGASTGIQMMLSTIIAKPNDAVLIPIPQYPIYSALIKLLNGEQVGYQMDESTGWSLDMGELTRAISECRLKGSNPKALVVINPGNPVGNCLSYDNIVELVKLCKIEGLVLLADEVYQENIYMDRPFVSVKKVVRDLGKEFEGFELASFHSTSKGIIGECGRRGGYMELCGLDSEVQAQIYKLASAGLCSNLDGQVMVDLMVKPPAPGDASYEEFQAQSSAIFNSLKRKSQFLYDALNSIEGIECQPLQGAMYAFPSIKLSEKAIKAAGKNGHAPDTFYALSLLEQTGICAVPGSGFGQKKGTHHIRMTFLPAEDKLKEALVAFKKHHVAFMEKYKD